MKKLFTISAIALVLCGLFAVSCKKETIAAILAGINFKTSSTAALGNNNPTVTNGFNVEVSNGSFVRIEPLLPDEWKKCNGTWTQTIEGTWTNDDYSCGKDLHTGVVNFIPKKTGVFKITFTYTCPDGSKTSRTITITVK
jgi:hypothetical protein